MAEQKPKMSREYLEVEEKNRQEQVVKENVAEAERTNVYWHQAARGQLGNFVPEQRSGGVITQGEEPLQFENHIFTTSDVKTIEFIEGRKNDKGQYENHPHRSFANGTIIRCKDMDEALEKTRALNRTRGGVRTIESVVSITPPKMKVEA